MKTFSMFLLIFLMMGSTSAFADFQFPVREKPEKPPIEVRPTQENPEKVFESLKKKKHKTQEDQDYIAGFKEGQAFARGRNLLLYKVEDTRSECANRFHQNPEKHTIRYQSGFLDGCLSSSQGKNL